MGPFDILAEQHRELEERFEALEASSGAAEAEERRDQAQAFVALLRLHTRLEERHLSPLLLTRAEERARAHEEAEDHLTMRELLDELEEQPFDAPEWWARLVTLEDLLMAHVRREEDQLFPRLSAALSGAERGELRRALEASCDELSSRGRSWPHSPSTLNEPSEPSWDI
jgi:hemerythrin-like domain-containing protein